MKDLAEDIPSSAEPWRRAALYACDAITGVDPLGDQIYACTAYANARGWNVVASYADSVHDGSNFTARRGLDGLLAATRNAAFDTLVVARVDRLASDALSAAEVVVELAHYGLEVHSVCEGVLAYPDPICAMVEGTPTGREDLERTSFRNAARR